MGVSAYSQEDNVIILPPHAITIKRKKHFWAWLCFFFFFCVCWIALLGSMKKKKRTENITEHAARLCEAMYEDMLYELKLIVNISFFVPPPPTPEPTPTSFKPVCPKSRSEFFWAAPLPQSSREREYSPSIPLKRFFFCPALGKINAAAVFPPSLFQIEGGRRQGRGHSLFSFSSSSSGNE